MVTCSQIASDQRLTPSHKGVILPDEEVTISLSIFVDETSAPSLNTGQAQLQHTLILHTVRGKDHFIVVSGDYSMSRFPLSPLLMVMRLTTFAERTCFANEISALVRLPGPIRQSIIPIESPSEKARTRTNAPQEVMRLINWLMTNATDIVSRITCLLCML